MGRGFFESDEDYQNRVSREAAEQTIRENTGAEPRQGWLESKEEFASRLQQEANESIIEAAGGAAPSQGWLESDSDFRRRVAQDSAERLIESRGGSPPSQGIFESDQEFRNRMTLEANEGIVETGTGSAPRKGFFESEHEFRRRVTLEANELRSLGRTRSSSSPADNHPDSGSDAWASAAKPMAQAPVPRRTKTRGWLWVMALLFIVAAVAMNRGWFMRESEYISASPEITVPLHTSAYVPPNTTIFDEMRGSQPGEPTGVSFVTARGFSQPKSVGVFTQRAGSRIEYGRGIPKEGTLEWWVNIRGGYYYHDYRLFEHQDQAVLFSTDAFGGDVTWPGAAKVFVSRNGDIALFIATGEHDDASAQLLTAKATAFRFDQWHSIGISFGSAGQFVMFDGVVVAAAPERKQALGAAGDHSQPLDVPTIGDTVSHFWDHNQYDGGFEGSVGLFRASKAQQDWFVARGIGD